MNKNKYTWFKVFFTGKRLKNLQEDFNISDEAMRAIQKFYYLAAYIGFVIGIILMWVIIYGQ